LHGVPSGERQDIITCQRDDDDDQAHHRKAQRIVLLLMTRAEDFVVEVN
jgi:hypothetical protein